MEVRRSNVADSRAPPYESLDDWIGFPSFSGSAWKSEDEASARRFWKYEAETNELFNRFLGLAAKFSRYRNAP